MSVTSRKSISGDVTKTIQANIEYDSMGAQIVDVLFFDEFDTKVVPVSGTYTIEATSNGRDWIPFSGIAFPCSINAKVLDWQYGGYIKQIRAVPNNIQGAITWSVEYRTHGIGQPSLVASATKSNNFYTALHTIGTSAEDFALQQGEILQTSQLFTIPANTAYSIKIDTNVTSIVKLTALEGATIAYLDGEVGGTLIDTIPLKNLNITQGFDNSGLLNIYDGAPTGESLYEDISQITERFIVADNGVISIRNNNTMATINAYLKMTIQTIGEVLFTNILQADTLLEANTEMSLYNGAN